MLYRKPWFMLFSIISVLFLSMSGMSGAQDKAELEIYLTSGELSDADIAVFEEANPDIKLTRIIESLDPTVLNSRLAAGNAPDIIRVAAFQVPRMVQQGLLLDLTPYFEASEALSIDDFSPSADYYVLDGKYYGLPKDWSPDFSLFVNDAVFAEAGLDMPSDTEAMTYEQVAELATQLTVKEGDRTTRFGLLYDYLYIERFLQVILAEQDVPLYSDDFTSVNLVNNEPAKEVLRYFYDLSEAGVIPSPLNPPASWPGEVFTSETGAMIFYGYWFGGVINGLPEDSPLYDNVTMLPGATWTGENRFNPTWGPTGVTISADTEHPEEAYRFFEWFISGPSSQARAASGWGVPPLVSLMELMPAETDFQKAALQQVQQEMMLPGYVIPVNPYYDPQVFGELWWTYLEEALRGNMTFDELVEALEADVNATIQDGMLEAN